MPQNNKDEFQPRGRKQRFRIREMGVLFAFILICIIFSIISPSKFLSYDNLLTVSRQISLMVIVGVAMTFVIITSNIDIAVGSYLALSGVIVATLIYYNIPWYFALIITMIMMAIVGLLVGIIIAKQRLSSLIVTLAMLTIARGIALSYSGGVPVFIKDETFLKIGTGYFASIPIPVIIAIVVLLVGQIILKKFKFGRYVYAIGGNEEAAISSGVNVQMVKMTVFAVSGFLSGLAGSILAARLYSGNPTAGDGFEFDVISAVVIGGTSLFGGFGNMWGTLLGAFIVGTISNGLTIIGVSYYFQLIVKGAIILIAIYIDKKTREIGRYKL